MTAATRIAKAAVSVFIFRISFTRDNLNHVSFKIYGDISFVAKLPQFFFSFLLNLQVLAYYRYMKFILLAWMICIVRFARKFFSAQRSIAKSDIEELRE